jgi:5-methylcytosine-specific restriction endonuclease McrA
MAAQLPNMPILLNRNVSFALKQLMWSKPCAICSSTGDIESDHIVPVCKGGSSSRENIQPLCRVCNVIKGNRRTNEEARLWILANRAPFREKQRRREWRRRYPSYQYNGIY